MPTYPHICDKCGKTEDVVRSVAERNNAPKCHGRMRRLVVAPSLHIPMEIRYRSPITNEPITNKQARIEDLKRSRSRPWEGLETEKQEAARQTAYADKALDESLTKTASEVFYQLPPSKREILTKGV
jgi:putative FmdB family regulatory protein